MSLTDENNLVIVSNLLNLLLKSVDGGGRRVDGYV